MPPAAALCFISKMARTKYVPRRYNGNRKSTMQIAKSRWARMRKNYYSNNIRRSGLLSIEYKFKANNHQQVISQDVASMAAMVADNCLNNVAQGNGSGNRIGQKYAITSVHVKGVIEFAATVFAGPGGGLSPVARIMLVIDKENNGNTVSQPDRCYDNPGAGASTVQDVFATRAIADSRRYRVLRDITLHKGPCGITYDGTNYVTQAVSCPFDIYHKFNTPVIVNCDTNALTGSRASIRSNAVDLYAISQDSASVITYRSRIRFTDA